MTACGAELIIIVELLLFLAPIAAFVWWRRAHPAAELSSRLLLMAALGLALMLAGALWLGFGRSIPRGRVYVPAVLAPDGTVVPGRPDGAR